MKRAIFIFAALLSVLSVQAQQTQWKRTIFFRQGYGIVETGYRQNGESIAVAAEFIRNIQSNDSIVLRSVIFSGSSSPEGGYVANVSLSQKRLSALEGVIRGRVNIADSLISRINNKIGWELLTELVKESAEVLYKSEVLNILENTPEFVYNKQGALVDSRKKQLMDLQGGRAWWWMEKNLFPELRNACVVTVCYESVTVLEPEVVEVATPQVIPVKEKEDVKETDIATKDTTEYTTAVISELRTVSDTPVLPVREFRKRPLLALKTNLLFDAASLLNVEVEVPLSPRWSVAGEWMFPWWLWEKKQHCLELLQGSIELRYWFKPDYRKQPSSPRDYNPLTGWFVGLYGGAGYYDLEWSKKGYQGEFFIATGISAGYVQPLSRNLSIEYSLGVGYMQTQYREYDAMFSSIDDKWHLIRRQNGSFSWFGPTKAKISLMWYPYFKQSKKGGMR